MPSSTATPVVTKLDFRKFASDVRRCGTLLYEDDKHDTREKKIRRDIADQAPAWVAAHVKDENNCESILVEGTNGHPDWSANARAAIEKALPYHRNSAGNKVSLLVA